jgi:hypothetical protein
MDIRYFAHRIKIKADTTGPIDVPVNDPAAQDRVDRWMREFEAEQEMAVEAEIESMPLTPAEYESLMEA